MDDSSIKTRLRVHLACRERQQQEQQTKQRKQQQERKQNRKRKREENSMTDRCKVTKDKSRKCEEQSLSASRVVKLRKTAVVHHRKRERTRIASSKLSNKRIVGNTVTCVCSMTKTRGLRKEDDCTCGRACKAETRKKQQSSQKQAAEGKPYAQQSSQIIPSAAPLMPTHFHLLAHFPVPEACKPISLDMVCLVDSRWALLSSEISNEGEHPPSFRLHKYEIPGGRLVWSTPLPPGVTDRCWKFCLPSEMVAEEDDHRGEIVLWQRDWTYVLDGEGQLLRSFKTVTMPEGVVSSGVVYNEQLGKTQKTQIVVRSLQDHSEVMTLGMGVRFTNTNICQEFETQRIAILSDRSTVTVFSSAGEQLTSWKLPYTCHLYKAMVWFNSSVLCVRQWPGQDLHLHAWDTGHELALFRTTEQLAMDNKDDLWEVDIRGHVANMIVYNFDTRLLRLATYRLQY